MAITVENTYTAAYKKVTSVTLSNVVVPTSSDRAIYVFIAGSTKNNGDVNHVSGITFNGSENFVKVGTGEVQNNKATSSIWKLIAPSDNTIADIVVSFDNNNSNWNGGGIVVEVLSGVHQTTSDDGWTSATGVGTAPSITSNTTTSDDLVHDVMGAGDSVQISVPTDNGEQTTTDFADITNTKLGIAIGHATGDGTTMVFAWTISVSTDWAMAITAIKVAAGGASTEQIFLPTTLRVLAIGQQVFKSTTLRVLVPDNQIFLSTNLRVLVEQQVSLPTQLRVLATQEVFLPTSLDVRVEGNQIFLPSTLLVILTTQLFLPTNLRVNATQEVFLPTNLRVNVTQELSLPSLLRIIVEVQKSLPSTLRVNATVDTSLPTVLRVRVADNQLSLPSTLKVILTSQLSLSTTLRVNVTQQLSLSTLLRVNITQQIFLPSTLRVTLQNETLLPTTLRVKVIGIQLNLPSILRVRVIDIQTSLSSTLRVTIQSQLSLPSTLKVLVTSTLQVTLSSVLRVKIIDNQLSLPSVLRVTLQTSISLPSILRVVAIQQTSLPSVLKVRVADNQLSLSSTLRVILVSQLSLSSTLRVIVTDDTSLPSVMRVRITDQQLSLPSLLKVIALNQVFLPTKLIVRVSELQLSLSSTLQVILGTTVIVPTTIRVNAVGQQVTLSTTLRVNIPPLFTISSIDNDVNCVRKLLVQAGRESIKVREDDILPVFVSGSSFHLYTDFQDIMDVQHIRLVDDLDHTGNNYLEGSTIFDKEGRINIGQTLPDGTEEILITYATRDGLSDEVIQMNIDMAKIYLQTELWRQTMNYSGSSTFEVMAKWTMCSIATYWSILAINSSNAIQSGYNYRIAEFEIQTKLWGEGMIAETLLNKYWERSMSMVKALKLYESNPDAPIYVVNRGNTRVPYNKDPSVFNTMVSMEAVTLHDSYSRMAIILKIYG